MLAAVGRGVLRLETAPPWVLDDPFALVLIGPAWQELRTGPVSLFSDGVIREILAGVGTRGRYAEDRLAAGAFTQYVILGAGLDSFAWRRPDLADTITRLQAYQAAGADVLYAPGLKSLADIRQVVASLDRPVNVLAVGGAPSGGELAGAGVSRVSVGGAFAFAALGALVDAATELRDKGTYGYLAGSAAGRRAIQEASR